MPIEYKINFCEYKKLNQLNKNLFFENQFLFGLINRIYKIQDINMLSLFIWAFPFLSICQNSELVAQGITSRWSTTTNENYFYIGTDDGFIHRVDVITGEVVWSVSTGGPIFDSKYQSTTTFFPSIDGFLVSFSPKYGYRRFPIPIRDLVFLAPFIAETGQIFTSGKSTSIYFVDRDGLISSTIKSNASIPVQSIDGDKTTLVRIDYSLNINGEISEVIRYSEFSVKPSNKDLRYLQNKNTISVTTTFSGGVNLKVNDTVYQFSVTGTPTIVFDSNGPFEFITERDGVPLGVDDLFLLNSNGAPVAVPSGPLTTVENSGLLIDDMPMINGKKGEDNNRYSLVEGQHEMNPFIYFKSLIPQADINRIANVMTDPGAAINFYKNRLQPSYLIISATLFIFYIGLRTIEYLMNKLKYSMQITIDPNDPSIGYLGDERCSIVRAKNIDVDLIKKYSILGLPTIKAIHSEGNGVKTLLFQPLVAYDFHSNNFDPKAFIQTAMRCLQSLFQNGLVHGSISKDNVFVDNNNDPLFGGYERTMRKSDQIIDRANDILSIATIVNNIINESDYAEKFNQNGEYPLLADLLYEMMIDDPEERPTPQEVLNHPLFLSGLQKMNIFMHASDFLMSPAANDRKLQSLFDENYEQVIGSNWMRTVDLKLVKDALKNTDYSEHSIVDLVRFIRNKYVHPLKLPDDDPIMSIFADQDTYFTYFHKLYPNLFLYTYYFIDKYEKFVDTN